MLTAPDQWAKIINDENLALLVVIKEPTHLPVSMNQIQRIQQEAYQQGALDREIWMEQHYVIDRTSA